MCQEGFKTLWLAERQVVVGMAYQLSNHYFKEIVTYRTIDYQLSASLAVKKSDFKAKFGIN